MEWSLPVSVNIDGKNIKIRKKCDYRVVLDTIDVLNDKELNTECMILCALYIFYDIPKKTKSLETDVLRVITDINKATTEMLKIINLGKEPEEKSVPRIVDWKHDFPSMVPPINRVLGYSVRDENHYTHWYDFVGAFMEIGESSFTNIVSIRYKKSKGKKLDKWEEEFYRENRELIDLPYNLTPEEEEFLNSDW